MGSESKLRKFKNRRTKLCYSALKDHTMKMRGFYFYNSALRQKLKKIKFDD